MGCAGHISSQRGPRINCMRTKAREKPCGIEVCVQKGWPGLTHVTELVCRGEGSGRGCRGGYEGYRGDGCTDKGQWVLWSVENLSIFRLSRRQITGGIGVIWGEKKDLSAWSLLVLRILSRALVHSCQPIPSRF
ncbi:hypothetical protein WMY93_001404 [Mugilogobius chulae]|uniref:Uncharacterized protein n=1 Tax=Mugilogobius chulae TaxID=88201 RepID=A0AAW0Q1N9_9GOBI